MKKYVAAVFTGLLFAAEIVLLKIYDVAAIGPRGTEVGFSHINKKVHEMTDVNMKFYELTEYMGYVAIGVCVIFALAGLVQLIKRRSLFDVDREIIALGFLFAAAIGFYVLFEKVIINYRPVIMPGETEPEASFPSSHTVLILVVMVAVMMIIGKYVGSGLAFLIRLLCVLAVIFTVGGRLYSGVHWFTDIVGGILLSTTMLLVYAGVISSAVDYESRGASTRGYTPKH